MLEMPSGGQRDDHVDHHSLKGWVSKHSNRKRNITLILESSSHQTITLAGYEYFHQEERTLGKVERMFLLMVILTIVLYADVVDYKFDDFISPFIVPGELER